MFETLHDLVRDHMDKGADALQRDGAFAVLVDPSGVYVVFRACKNHEVDFACCTVGKDGEWTPARLTPDQYGTIVEWLGRMVPLLCRIWKRRHPQDVHAKAEPWKLGSGVDQ